MTTRDASTGSSADAPGAAERFEFVAPVEAHDFGRVAYTVVYLPEPLARRLPFERYPRLRVDAEIEGRAINAVFQPGGGRRYLILSKQLLSETGLALGRRARVSFAIADQERVDVPEALVAALAANAPLQRAWDALPAGERRGLAHRVGSARTAPTAAKRVEEVLAGLAGPAGRHSASGALRPERSSSHAALHAPSARSSTR